MTLLVLSFLSDRVNLKGCFVIAGLTSALIGYILLLTAKTTVVKVVATCFVVGGIYPGVLLSIVWLGINTAGFTKRATTWAMAEIGAQVFSIVGTNVYKSAGPTYAKGHWVNVGFMIVGIVAASALMWWYSYSNKKRNRILAEHEARGQTHPHIGRSLEELYDLHINFRYVTGSFRGFHKRHVLSSSPGHKLMPFGSDILYKAHRFCQSVCDRYALVSHGTPPCVLHNPRMGATCREWLQFG